MEKKRSSIIARLAASVCLLIAAAFVLPVSVHAAGFNGTSRGLENEIKMRQWGWYFVHFNANDPADTTGNMSGTMYEKQDNGDPSPYTKELATNPDVGDNDDGNYQMFLFDTTQAFQKCGFKKAGYHFIGWSETPNGQTQNATGHDTTNGGAAVETTAPDVTLYLNGQNKKLYPTGKLYLYTDEAKTGNWTLTEHNKIYQLYAQWAPDVPQNSADASGTKYVVHHKLQNLADDGYPDTDQDTDTLYGTADASVTPATKTYTGFTAPSLQTVGLNGNGTTEITYYYTRNTYSVTVNAGQGTSGSVSGSTPAAVSGKYKYGSSVTVIASVADNYNWSSWNYGTNSTAISNFASIKAGKGTNHQMTFTMPAGNVILVPGQASGTYTDQKHYTFVFHNNLHDGVQLQSNDGPSTGTAKFLYWTTNPDGSGKRFDNLASVSFNDYKAYLVKDGQSSTADGAEVHLYAQWGHYHTGSSTSGGGCYTVYHAAVPAHHHKGSRSSGGECYGRKVVDYRCTRQVTAVKGGDWYNWTCPVHGWFTSTSVENVDTGKVPRTQQCSYEEYHYELNCGKDETNGSAAYYSTGCGFAEGQLLHQK